MCSTETTHTLLRTHDRYLAQELPCWKVLLHQESLCAAEALAAKGSAVESAAADAMVSVDLASVCWES